MNKLQDTVNENTKDISEIKHSIETIKNNHLWHIEKDMERQTKQIEKIDSRIWWVLGILVVSTIAGMIKNGL